MPYYMPKLAIPAPQSPDFTDNSIDFSSPLQNTLYPLRRTWILLAQVLPETSQLLVGLKGCKLHCTSEAKFCQSWLGGWGSSHLPEPKGLLLAVPILVCCSKSSDFPHSPQIY